MNDELIDYRFKILYCVGVVMVCCGHTSGGGISLLADWFPYYSFHLALFAFASGYFYKQKYEENIYAYVRRKAKNLILPMYMYNFVYCFIVQILKKCGIIIGGDISLENLFILPITNGHQYGYNLGTWFVVPLFMVEVFNVLFRKLIKKYIDEQYEIFICLIYFLIGVAGNTLAYCGINTGWWLVLTRVSYFLPFYGIGISYKYKLEEMIANISTGKYILLLFIVQLCIICLCSAGIKYSAVWCNNFVDGPVMPIVVGLSGIAIWIKIASILEPICGKNRIVNLIADNAYSIMANQFLGFMLVKTMFMVASRVLPLFDDFDIVKYKTDLYYYYIPNDCNNILIIYVVAGIVFSIYVQRGIDIIKYPLINKVKLLYRKCNGEDCFL